MARAEKFETRKNTSLEHQLNRGRVRAYNGHSGTVVDYRAFKYKGEYSTIKSLSLELGPNQEEEVNEWLKTHTIGMTFTINRYSTRKFFKIISLPGSSPEQESKSYTPYTYGSSLPSHLQGKSVEDIYNYQINSVMRKLEADLPAQEGDMYSVTLELTLPHCGCIPRA